MELPPKVWFRLERFKRALRSLWGEKGQSYDTSHRMCPSCRGLISRDENVCPLCGANLRSARARASAATPGRVLGIIPIPSTATSMIVVATLALYAISWYMSLPYQSSEPSGGLFSMGGISGQVLLRLGAKSPYIFVGQWWRLVTAIFLHAGLLHIGFNLWCLFDLGPEVEALFCTTKFTVFYLATGVAGFVASLWWMPFGMSVGASGAILGLIGVLVGWSFHHGHLGKDYRRMLLRWVLYILIFGIFFGADNAAHIGGLALGIIFGYLVPDGEPPTRASEGLWNALALISVLIIAASFALMALQLTRPAG